MIALSVAAALAVFILYTSAFASSTPQLKPSELRGHSGSVSLVGQVVGPVAGDPHAAGMRFVIRDIGGKGTVPVKYTGSVPDLFKVGRHVVVEGTLRQGVFVAKPDSLVTKCPSKYAPKKS